MQVEEYKGYTPPAGQWYGGGQPRTPLQRMLRYGRTARNLYRAGKSYYGSRSKSTPKRNYKRRVNSKPASVKVGGTTANTVKIYSKKRKARRKPSLAKKVSKLTKLIPKQSKKTFRDFRFMQMRTTGNAQRRIYTVNVFTKGNYNTYLSNLTAVDSAGVADYEATNTSVKLDQFYRLKIKNNATANVDVKYCFYICKDDDNEDPAQSAREELIDRGYSMPLQSAEQAANPTQVYQPARYQLNFDDPTRAPFFSGGAQERNWRKHGKVMTITLGPGDTISPTFIRNNFTVKPEVIDQENAFAHISNYTVCLLVDVRGDLGHDIANKGVLGYSLFCLDCEEQRQVTIKYPNPKGLDEVVYTDTDTVTNLNTVTMADNFDSAMEAANI